MLNNFNGKEYKMKQNFKEYAFPPLPNIPSVSRSFLQQRLDDSQLKEIKETEVTSNADKLNKKILLLSKQEREKDILQIMNLLKSKNGYDGDKDFAMIQTDGRNKKVVTMKKLGTVKPATLDGLLGENSPDGSPKDFKYWAGVPVDKEVTDFKKKASPTNKWQSAYYNGGVF